MLLDRSIDIGLISSGPFDDPDLRQHRVCDDELAVVFAPSHRFSSFPAVDAQTIAEERFIFHRSDSTTRQMTMQWAADNGVVLHANMELDSLETIKRTIVLGGGISFISRIAVAEEVKRGDLSCLPLPGHQANSDSTSTASIGL